MGNISVSPIILKCILLLYIFNLFKSIDLYSIYNSSILKCTHQFALQACNIKTKYKSYKIKIKDIFQNHNQQRTLGLIITS